MEVKYSLHFLSKVEDIFAESDYILRYEKGNFKSGYCVIRESKVVVVNKYYPLEGRINCLLEILKSIELDANLLNPKNFQLYNELKSLG